MTRKEAKQHIEHIRRERFWLDDVSHKPSENPLMAMLRRALNQLATGIFEHAHHYVFELTQNADDNNYPADAERFLKFVLLEDDPTSTPGSQGCLCVLNDETGFERKHVESLCDIGNSTKKDNREGYIGEKGIGFKSVFLISDRPHIVSNGYNFHFRRDDCDAGLGYVVPHWNEQVPSVAEGSLTAILLPLRGASGVDVAKQLADIEPECILFLRRLRRIELVSAKSGLKRAVRSSGSQGFVSLEADGTTASYFVHRSEHSCADVHESLREGVSSTVITVALPLSAPETTDGRVFAFLPTEVRTGLPFLINADFLLAASRERIHEAPIWNQHLVKSAAATFVEAFGKLRGAAKYRTAAYRYIPIKTDLLPGNKLFTSLVDAVQQILSVQECIVTTAGECVLPSKAYFAGPLMRALLSEIPPKLAGFPLVHPDLEEHRKRLEPLGVRSLSICEVLAICDDADWLCRRSVEWWETLFELLSRYNVAEGDISDFPLLRCADGVCRQLGSEDVFFQAESNLVPLSIPPDWPTAHVFDRKLQSRIQKKPAVWEWLVRVADLRPFSIQSYITSSLIDWMLIQDGEQAASRLLDATRFIASNLKHLDGEAREKLAESLPWVLADGRLLRPDQRENQELVTPECLEGEAGWNWVFISEHDRQHFYVLADAYSEDQPAAVKKAVKGLMAECGATDFPNPAQRNRPDGKFDWVCPRWLRDLSSEQPPKNLRKKVMALERWIERFKTDDFVQFLSLGAADEIWRSVEPRAQSELGLALRTHPWLRTTKGLVSPTSAFVADAEIRAFLGDSVPYVKAELSSEILGELGVHLRLSADALFDLLRRMRDSGEVNEAQIVRIYKRLATMAFDAETFRTEPLIFLSRPAARWEATGRVFWKDAGDVFDDEFGYAYLTYGGEELHGFFTETLGVHEEVPEQQLAEVWAKMSGGDSPPPDVVEKRLNKIFQNLVAVLDADNPPEWWLTIRRRLKIWTTAKRFEVPKNVFAPDNTFAEEVFAGTAPIAWIPKSHLTARLNRLLRELGCRSLAENLRSRAVNPAAVPASASPRILTQATKELLVCWVCAVEGWRKNHLRLEQLLKSAEVTVDELHVEYWLEGMEETLSSREADAFLDSENQRLYLRSGATAKAQQSAAATSVAAQLERRDKQDEDTVYRLLGLEVADAIREKAKRKWELTPEQIRWLNKIEVNLEVLKISDDDVKQRTREARPAIVEDGVAGNESAGLTATGGSEEVAPDRSTDSSDTSQTEHEGEEQEAESRTTDARVQDGRSAEAEPARALKSADAETEFVHVVAHTRVYPRRERQQRETADRNPQEQHPMAGISHATKAAIEEAAVQVIKRQFQKCADLREFNFLDRRKDNCGYDVHAAKPGRVIRIEIKAHLREAKSVFVTQREWQQSRQQNRLAADDKWELWNVENLALDAGMVRITRYRYLPDDARTRESGYWVDLSACASESIQ